MSEVSVEAKVAEELVTSFAVEAILGEAGSIECSHGAMLGQDGFDSTPVRSRPVLPNGVSILQL